MTTTQSEVTVAFDGNKFFWRTRNVVDVVIVPHSLLSVYEVIVYEPSLDKEAPRLYINTDALMSIIDQGDIDTKLSFAMRNGIPLTDKFVQSVRNGVISEFVLARLVIKDLDRESKIFSVELQNQSDIDWLCPAPASLCPYQTRHFCNLKEGEMAQALTVLQQETKELHSTTEDAAVLAGLTVRERWRIPLVMGKVIRGKRLRKTDARIFNHVQANMKTDEDTTRMKATLRVDTSPARTPRTGKSVHSPKPLARGNSSLFTATASSMHKAASISNLHRSEKTTKPQHHKRTSKIAGTSTKAALSRKKSKRLSAGASADGTGKAPTSHMNRLMSGLSQFGARLRVNLGLQATTAKDSEPVSPLTPTVRYTAQAGLSQSQDEEPPVCTAGPTPCAVGDLTPVMTGAGEQSLSFDDALAEAHLTAALITDAMQARQLQLMHPDDLAAAAEEEVGGQECAETPIRAKPTKRSSLLVSFLQAITAGINSSFGTGDAASHKECGDSTSSQRTFFKQWGSSKSKVAPED